MQREEMERIFCWKIGAELKGYQYSMMQKSKEEIFASAYQIDCMVRIYELLVEISQKIEMAQMQKCMEISSLLAFLYERWLKTQDTQTQELEEVLQAVLQDMKAEVA